jgi:hypothetical protein
MRTIYKYTLNIDSHQAIEVPSGAEFLSAQIQNGKVCVWALVDPNAKKELELFIIAGTGHPFPEQPKQFQFLGTVQQAGGALVWHIFRAVK